MKKWISTMFNIVCLLILQIIPICSQTESQRTPPRFNQQSEEIGLVFGFHQHSYSFFELGLYMAKSKEQGCAFGTFFDAISLSGTYNPVQKITGFELNALTGVASMIAYGISLNSYTNFTNTNFGIRPYIGLGTGRFALTYGYNLQVKNSGLTGLNRHTFSLRYHLTVFEK